MSKHKAIKKITLRTGVIYWESGTKRIAQHSALRGSWILYKSLEALGDYSIEEIESVLADMENEK